MSLINNVAAVQWRKQFHDPDHFISAGELLKKFRFVSANEFKRDLRRLILSNFPEPEKVAFYVERELQRVRPHWPYKRSDGREVINRSHGRVAIRMYKEVSSVRGPNLPKRWTAAGSAVQAVRSPNSIRQEVGSEGVVAALVSKLCVTNSSRFVMNPHTTALRRIGVKHLVVVTDFVGSGDRACDMLDSLWRVASVRSWVSSGYRKLTVLCYSGTDQGMRKVRRHPCNPSIVQVRTCPTVSGSFGDAMANVMTELCKKFPPGADLPLGYKDTGALIAFEHSCPNNVPAMFTLTERSKARAWTALFPKRSSDVFSESAIEYSDKDDHAEALESLRCGNIARNSIFIESSPEQRAMITLLAALYRGRRNSEDLVSATGLSFVTLLDSTARAQQNFLMTASGRLTASGFSLIAELNDLPVRPVPVPNEAKNNYYPVSLRAPF